MSALKVIRFESHNPSGGDLPRRPDMARENVESGTPVQSGIVYYENPEIGLRAGVWECTAFTSRLGPYPVHEFMLLLEGEVTVEETGGRTTTVKAGESFVIPRGLHCRWIQKGRVKKYYVIYDPKTPLSDATAGKIVKLDHHQAPNQTSPSPSPEVLIGPVPRQHGQDFYTDPSGQLQIGTWDTTYYHRKVVPFPRYELMHFLEGAVSITHRDGGTQSFKAGDTMFVPFGAEADFKIGGDYLRKIYVIFQPKA